MSRSIGDLFAETLGVCAEPTVKKVLLTQKQEFIVVASDGIWEFLENIEVVKMVDSFGKDKVQEAADALAEKAYKRWIDEEEDLVDDITIIIHYFN